MELWIRSLDKTALMQVKDIRIYYDKKDNVQMIMIKDCAGEYVSMGVYSTKERALEVLDEIQEKMFPKLGCNYHNDYRSVLYEMPEE